MSTCEIDCNRLANNLAASYGFKVITVDVEAQSNILFVAPGNLYLRLTTETILSAGTGKGTAAAQAVTSYQRFVTYTPVLATGSTIDSTQQISNMELYINKLTRNGLYVVDESEHAFASVKVNKW